MFHQCLSNPRTALNQGKVEFIFRTSPDALFMCVQYPRVILRERDGRSGQVTRTFNYLAVGRRNRCLLNAYVFSIIFFSSTGASHTGACNCGRPDTRARSFAAVFIAQTSYNRVVWSIDLLVLPRIITYLPKLVIRNCASGLFFLLKVSSEMKLWSLACLGKFSYGGLLLWMLLWGSVFCATHMYQFVL